MVLASPRSHGGRALALLDTALASGSFLDAEFARLHALPISLAALFVQQGAMAFSAFCLGLLAARTRLLADPEQRCAQWRRIAVIGLAAGLSVQIAGGALALGPRQHDVALDYRRPRDDHRLRDCADPGRRIPRAPRLGPGVLARHGLLRCDSRPASLSVHIGESVLLSLLFCGYGLGAFGQWGAFPVVVSGIASWGVLALLARAWLSRFDQGPLEALLARWTGKRSAGAPTPAV